MVENPLEDAPSTPVRAESVVLPPKARDSFDPLAWELPVVCKDCDKQFNVPYRHFQAGVVFHCPHCHGSYVPTLPMYQRIRDAFDSFYGRMKRERDRLTEPHSQTAFNKQFEAELARFKDGLERLARELRPAGKMVRRKGLAAMFT